MTKNASIHIFTAFYFIPIDVAPFDAPAPDHSFSVKNFVNEEMAVQIYPIKQQTAAYSDGRRVFCDQRPTPLCRCYPDVSSELKKRSA
ncbi:hypothetical protein [Sporolactobacillus sp. KGMB 08714]|uniref:hypothetical protein n=1 Tax=Sporolactobacillus sp. KGMB 08714 TaxID=3064704 RepID=UPI002FBE9E6A